MRLRLMTEADIPAGMRLKELAGWNQTEEDWTRFLRGSPGGCFVAETNGKVCGTATTIPYENRFAWIGMVLVDPEYRSRGFGTQLLRRAIEYLDDLRIPTMKLDATPQGKPIYEKLGFVPEYEIERWTFQTSDNARSATEGVGSNPVAGKLWETILTKDNEVFGARRGSLLEDLNKHAPHFTIAALENHTLTGYAFGRHGSFADHLGPWFATKAAAAQSILETFLGRSHRQIVIVDCLKHNALAGPLLRFSGFTYSRPLTRMFRGRNHYPGEPANLCAILGPEFG